MYSTPTLTSASTSSGPSPVILLIYVAIIVLIVAAMWRVFTKAGKPGWAAIIPIYNTIELLDIAGRPWWWIFLLLIPLVNLVVLIMICLDVATAFGKSAVFAIFGLLLFPYVGYPMLGFGSAKYVRGGGAADVAPTATPPAGPPPPAAPPMTPPAGTI